MLLTLENWNFDGVCLAKFFFFDMQIELFCERSEKKFFGSEMEGYLTFQEWISFML